MDLLSITFDQAYRETSRRRFIDRFEEAEKRLLVIQKIAAIAGVYRAVRANDSLRGREEARFSLPNLWELRQDPEGHFEEHLPFSRLCEEAVAYFSGKFPLHEDPTYENWADPNCDYYPFYILNPGADLCWDDLYELLGDPEMFRPEAGLMAFSLFTLFLQDNAENDSCFHLWQAASKHFRWGVELPWWQWLPQQDWRLDREAFYALLENGGLAQAAAAFRMYWHNSGNFFLDLESDEYGYVDDDGMQALTYENAVALMEAWQKAQPTYKKACEAEAEAYQHPEIYQTLVDLLGRCIMPVEKSTSREQLMAAAKREKQRALKSEAEKEDQNAK
jgi:hypothetical protein